MATRNSPTTPAPRRPAGLPPDHAGMLWAAFAGAVAGWGGLFWLVTTHLPRIGGEIWLFFALLTLAVTSTALPVVRYAIARLSAPGQELPAVGVIVRRSLWIGLWVTICAWLQIPRTLSPLLAALLALIFVGMEVFLTYWERSGGRG
jgi:hypothetical protein